MLVFPKDYEIKYFSDLNCKNLDDLLKNSYSQIYDSISKDYILEYLDFDIFREIKFNGEVVGFFTLKHLEEKRFSIEDSYIMPKYRGNDLLIDELINLGCIPNVYLYVRRPTFAFMSMLKKHGLVEKFVDNIVALGMDTLIDSSDVYVNPKISLLYDLKHPISNWYASYVYDFDSKLLFIQDMWANISCNPGMIVIAKPRKSDLEKYDYKKTFKKFTLTYIDEISARLYPKYDDIVNSWGLWENLIDDYASVENIIGSANKLTDETLKLLNEKGLDESVAFDIREHILKANDKVQLKEKYNKIRRNYLLNHPDKIKKEDYDKNLYYQHKLCPLCENPRTIIENCDYCGFDFENMDFW